MSTAVGCSNFFVRSGEATGEKTDTTSENCEELSLSVIDAETNSPVEEGKTYVINAVFENATNELGPPPKPPVEGDEFPPVPGGEQYDGVKDDIKIEFTDKEDRETIQYTKSVCISYTGKVNKSFEGDARGAGEYLVEMSSSQNTVSTELIVTKPFKLQPEFEYSPDEPSSSQRISFDATDTLIEGGSINAYEWDFGKDDSTDASGRTVSTRLDPGIQQVALTVVADNGETETIVKDIEVEADVPADPSFEQSPDTPNAGVPVRFDASTTTQYSAVERYEWDFTGDGSVDATGKKAVHEFEEGVYTVTLTVRGVDGDEVSTEAIVNVAPEPVSLQATASSTDLRVGEETIVTYSVNNYLRNDELTVQLLLETPSDVSVTQVQNARGSNQFTAVKTLPPADQGNILISLTVNEPGTHTIDATADYYFGDDTSNGGRTTEPITITATDPDGAGDDSTDDSINEEAPGFSVGSALAGVGLTSYLLKHRLDDD